MTWEPTRRTLLQGAALTGSAALIGIGAMARGAWANGQPFSLGVASGEPVPDGMVLWTRLAPAPLAADGGMGQRRVPVRWEIAEDAQFQRVRSGTTMALPEHGHAVHVEVSGLRPGRVYWYRFIAEGEVSPVGRTRTAPAPGAVVDRLRLAFASCQKYEVGFYAAWRHMVADDPDLIFFLGDYIYEGDPSDKGVRRHKNPEPKDVAGYRVRYASYKTDPLLQAAHHAAPWIVTWDDHEVANNYAANLDEHDGDIAQFMRRRAAAYQVYWEHMPLRASARPTGADMRLYRTLDWGALAQFQVIDDRQYRSRPACQPPGTFEQHRDAITLRPECAERHDPARSILGARQEHWLMGRLGATRAQWNMLTQQTLMMPYRRIDPEHAELAPSVYNQDGWEGYPATRERIIRQWRDAKTPNPVILSGDIHAFVAADHVDPVDAKRIVAAEFVGGSITSLNHDATLKPGMARNPNFRFAENEVRGYGRADVTRARCEVAFRGLADATDEKSGVRDLARFTVESGRTGIQT